MSAFGGIADISGLLSPLLRSPATSLAASSSSLLHCMSPLLALSEHVHHACECPLSGVRRTSRKPEVMSAYDPKRTSTRTFVREFLATVSRDRSFIPFNPDARKVGNFEAAVLDGKWFFQDRIGPILPLQPVRGFGHAHQMRRNFRI